MSQSKTTSFGTAAIASAVRLLLSVTTDQIPQYNTHTDTGPHLCGQLGCWANGANLKPLGNHATGMTNKPNVRKF